VRLHGLICPSLPRCERKSIVTMVVSIFFLPLLSLWSLFLSPFICLQSTLGCYVCLCVPINNFIVIIVAPEVVDDFTPLWSCWCYCLLLCDGCYKWCVGQASLVVKSHCHCYSWCYRQSDSLIFVIPNVIDDLIPLWSCCCCVTIVMQVIYVQVRLLVLQDGMQCYADELLFLHRFTYYH